MRPRLALLALLAGLLPHGAASATVGIHPSWPAGSARRGEIEIIGSASYVLRGVGYCRGGPPGGELATAMVSYVRMSGAGTPKALECFEICARLRRCAGVEVRNSDDWCELQVPLLSRVGDGTDERDVDWRSGEDAAMEEALTSGFDSLNAVVGSPAALTTVVPVNGFYCWAKQNSCGEVPPGACEDAGRHPCEESYWANTCGACRPLHVAVDGSDPRAPGPAASACVPDPGAALPTLQVALASPWYSGRWHDETLYLAVAYGVKKAWMDGAAERLIPVPLAKRMPFPMNITGHTESWNYTLTAEQLTAFGMDASVGSRIDNHPMSGFRAMAALRRDEYVERYRLMEPADKGRRKPHCIIGGTPDASMSGVYPHSNIDLPLSHAATFYETPILGWAFRTMDFADKTTHAYYIRVNPVGLHFDNALVSLIQHFGYTRVGVVTPGTNRHLVRGLQDNMPAGVTLRVEDMNLERECGVVVFDGKCHAKLIASLDALQQEDMRIIIHEHGGLTQLENYWPIFSGLLRSDTLLIQVGAWGDCRVPMLPSTQVYSEGSLWQSIFRSSNLENRGDWDQMPGDCRVCQNWAFTDLPRAELANRTKVAHHNIHRVSSVYDWTHFCPELMTVEDILACEWCDQYASIWISPTCGDEIAAMRRKLSGSMCIGVENSDDEDRIDRWADYLASLTADELVAAGAPKEYFDIFEPGHPLHDLTGVTMAERWSGPWRGALREKAAFLDALLLSVVAFNTWVRSAGESSPSLSASELRSGFLDIHNTAIKTWLSTLRGTAFDGLTGKVRFESVGERELNYTVYSAYGDDLSYHPVASYTLSGSLVHVGEPAIFNDGSSTPPPDSEPACAPGTRYITEERGCRACPEGSYCPGDGSPHARVPAIPCRPGTVAPEPRTASCESCPPGTSPNELRTLCIPCPSGRHLEGEGQLVCSECARGRFWSPVPPPPASLHLVDPSNPLVSSCEECPLGSFQDATGATECKPCRAGQQTFALGAVASGACLCAAGHYKPEGDGDCARCPLGMVCDVGSAMANYRAWASGGSSAAHGTGAFPRLLPGFWSSSDDPLYVFSCGGGGEACPGGEPGSCSFGSSGMACASCPENYFRLGGHCHECGELASSRLLFPTTAIVLATPVVILCYLISRVPAERESSPQAGLATCCKAILMHLQIEGMLWRFNIHVSGALERTAAIFSDMTLGFTILQPSCVGVVAFEDKYFLNISLPLMMLLWFLMTFGISRALNALGSARAKACGGGSRLVCAPLQRCVVHRMDGDCLFSGFGMLMETFFVAVVGLSMSLFSCYDHPNGRASLRIAPQVLCDSDERRDLVAVGIAAIAVYAVGGATVVAWVLFVAPRRCTHSAFRKRWRFLLAKYRPGVHWWSAAILVRSLLLALGPIVFSQGSHQLLHLAAVLSVYGLAAHWYRPWRHIATNSFDVAMSAALVATASALLFFAASPKDTATHAAVADEVATYTQVASTMPLLVALGVGSRLVWACARPQRWEDARRDVADKLEDVGALLKDGESSAILRQRILNLAEVDTTLLHDILRSLLSASVLHVSHTASDDCRSHAIASALEARGRTMSRLEGFDKGNGEVEQGEGPTFEI